MQVHRLLQQRQRLLRLLLLPTCRRCSCWIASLVAAGIHLLALVLLQVLETGLAAAVLLLLLLLLLLEVVGMAPAAAVLLLQHQQQRQHHLHLQQPCSQRPQCKRCHSPSSKQLPWSHMTQQRQQQSLRLSSGSSGRLRGDGRCWGSRSGSVGCLGLSRCRSRCSCSHRHCRSSSRVTSRQRHFSRTVRRSCCSGSALECGCCVIGSGCVPVLMLLLLLLLPGQRTVNLA
jgi:hypothetical protein